MEFKGRLGRRTCMHVLRNPIIVIIAAAESRRIKDNAPNGYFTSYILTERHQGLTRFALTLMLTLKYVDVDVPPINKRQVNDAFSPANQLKNETQQTMAAIIAVLPVPVNVKVTININNQPISNPEIKQQNVKKKRKKKNKKLYLNTKLL